MVLFYLCNFYFCLWFVFIKGWCMSELVDLCHSACSILRLLTHQTSHIDAWARIRHNIDTGPVRLFKRLLILNNILNINRMLHLASWYSPVRLWKQVTNIKLQIYAECMKKDIKHLAYWYTPVHVRLLILSKRYICNE